MSKTVEENERVKFLAIKLLAETDGGKLITSSLLKDITASIERLSTDYKTATHIELVRHCADLNSRLSLYRVLTRAEKNLDDIELLIKEALEDTDE